MMSGLWIRIWFEKRRHGSSFPLLPEFRAPLSIAGMAFGQQSRWEYILDMPGDVPCEMSWQPCSPAGPQPEITSWQGRCVSSIREAPPGTHPKEVQLR